VADTIPPEVALRADGWRKFRRPDAPLGDRIRGGKRFLVANQLGYIGVEFRGPVGNQREYRLKRGHTPEGELDGN
jgi:hypothetical protein